MALAIPMEMAMAKAVVMVIVIVMMIMMYVNVVHLNLRCGTIEANYDMLLKATVGESEFMKAIMSYRGPSNVIKGSQGPLKLSRLLR
eukprot:11646098-Karenia_brevis.AAC.1